MKRFAKNDAGAEAGLAGTAILILEDNEDRTEAMRCCLEGRIGPLAVLFFRDAPAMLRHLQAGLRSAAVISLDHDLELTPTRDGTLIDPGTGRDVADYLASQAPVCPVIIHSTNTDAALGMEMALREARWSTYRVTPFDDLAWIPSAWLWMMRRALRSTGLRSLRR